MTTAWAPDKPSFITGGFVRALTPSDALVTLPITETWTVADASGTLTGDFSWVDYIGSHGWDVVGQAAELNSAGSITQGGRLNIDVGTDDYEVTVTLEEFSPVFTGLLAVGPCVRMQGDTSLTFYTLSLVSTGGATADCYLFRFVSGVQTQIGASAPVTWHAGMTLKLRVQGVSLRGYVDGAPVITVTDASIPTGSYAGLQGVASSTALVRVATWRVTAPSPAAFVPLEWRTLTPANAVGV